MTRYMLGVVSVSSFVAIANAGAMRLTESDFNKVVFNSGKNAFVNFLAPGSGHCKAMKPDWDKLGSAYADHANVVVADVDCTSDEGKSICKDNQVHEYPTIKYFTADTGQGGRDYWGDRHFAAMEIFVRSHLAKKCEVDTLENCDDQEKAYIEKQKGKDQDSLFKESDRLKGMQSGDMTEEKKVWLTKRTNILIALAEKQAAKQDL